MRDKFYHESLYRGDASLQKLSNCRLAVCGAGAVGSNLVHHLMRQGLRRVRVIDFDRVETHNISTQSYAENEVGMFKVEALQAELFRAVGAEIDPVRKKLTDRNVRPLLKDADLVVDGFDNHEARSLVTEHCRSAAIPCVHVGLSAEYAEVVWNETYRVPGDVLEPDVCDYPMARNLILFAVALAGEAVVRFVLAGECRNFAFTLKDLAISEVPAC